MYSPKIGWFWTANLLVLFNIENLILGARSDRIEHSAWRIACKIGGFDIDSFSPCALRLALCGMNLVLWVRILYFSTIHRNDTKHGFVWVF
jgi:hypothetical protein